MMYAYSPHSWGLVNIHTIYYKFYKVHCINVCVLAKPIIYCYLCRLFSIAWLEDIHLNHYRKVPNALWMITCTHSIKLITTASKVFIKTYNTDISIETVYLYFAVWILRVLLPNLHTLTKHVPTVFSFHICAFFLNRITNWIFNRTCNLGHNRLPVLHHHACYSLI